MKCLLTLATLYLCIQNGHSQKYNRNWAFGNGCGIDFNDTSDVRTYWTRTFNFEVAASISDTLGNLLFYLGRENNGRFNIYDQTHNVIANGDSINIHLSMTYGALILPKPGSDKLFYVLHNDIYNSSSCPYFFCIGLFYSIVEANTTSNLIVMEKNKPVLLDAMGEKLSAVRHANGTDWWVLTQTAQKGDGFPCTNRFYIYILTRDSFVLHGIQDIGALRCDKLSQWGEMVFNRQGTQVAAAVGSQGIIDLFDFDRCDGVLSNHKIVDQEVDLNPYGCEFSPNGRYLYISSGFDEQPSKILQYDLENFVRTTIWVDTMGVLGGQLQIAPDGKIYFAMKWVYEPESRKLGIIHQPDSAGLACSFKPFEFYLGDSSKPDWGLPNMPNYELESLTIYQAEAGEDKTWCSDDSIKGAYIGTQEISGVQYTWQPSEGLDNPNIAMPFANPYKTTMYVLSVTDTSIRYSCYTRDDTVWVRVENCDTNRQIFFPEAFTPNNDGSNDLFGPVSGIDLIGFRIYNRWGQVVHDAPAKWDGRFNGKEQPMGTFVYYAVVQVENEGRKKVSGAVSLLR